MAMESQRNYLRTYRKRLNLSLADIAFISGCANPTKVCRYEREIGDIKLRLAITYELVFGIPIKEIFQMHYEKQKLLIIDRIRKLRMNNGCRRVKKSKLAILSEVLSRISEN